MYGLACIDLARLLIFLLIGTRLAFLVLFTVNGLTFFGYCLFFRHLGVEMLLQKRDQRDEVQLVGPKYNLPAIIGLKAFDLTHIVSEVL